MSSYLFPQSLINKHVYLTFTVIQLANIFDFKCDILEPRGDNYKEWKERVLLHFEWMDTNYSIRKDELNPIAETSTTKVISLYENERGPIASL